MELTEEKENFVKLSHIVLDIIPIYLRIMFKDKWNEKYPSSKWTSDAKSGNTLCNKVSDGFYASKSNQEYIPRMRSGNEEEWDTTTLLRVILYSGMNLIEGCRPKEERSSPLRVSEGLEVIREIRNSAIAHTRGMSCSSEEFERTMADLKSVVGSLFGKDAEFKINEIAKSPIDMEIWGKKESLARKLLNEIKGDIGNLQLGYEKLEKGLSAIEKELRDQNEQRKPAPITEEAICKLKNMYKDRYEKHQIHIVDSIGRIELREIKLDEFAVKLKICQDESPKGNFRDEMRRFLDKVQNFEDSDCEISMLLNKDMRVTFVRGIAGMGKSVLAKQVAYGWANGIMYGEFKLCIMFECRELNYFQDSKGDAVKKHEMLEEFLKMKLNLDLGIGEGILFVLDGLDELYDIQNEDSVIGQLVNLNSSKYIRSKIIITGRPHVEHKLKKLGNEMGGLQKLEILGLNQKEISTYALKFATLQGSFEVLNVPLPTGDPKSLLHVPQFLNTFFCVCVLTDGKIVQDSVELYCWTIYLLLKQHDADRHGSVKTQVAEIFKEYSKSLLTICEVCHNLLNENKIIFEGNIKDLIQDSEAGSSFIESLFVDVTDNFTKRYQFKHLSLMEFLAAIHICSNISSYMEAIQDNVSRGNTEVVMFVCVLISGFTADGIIQECLKNTTGITKINQNRFLKKVIRAFTKSKLDDEAKFLTCMEILQHFVKKSMVDANALLMSIEEIQFGKIVGMLKYVQISDYIITLCNHLVTVCKREAEIRKAFSNISFPVLYVRELKDIKCIRYLKSTGGIRAFGFTTDVTDIALKLTESVVGECKAFHFIHCTLEDDEKLDIELLASMVQISYLRIDSCSMDVIGFDNICEVGMRCKTFVIEDLKVEEEWWVTLTENIEERTTHGTCKLMELGIKKCSTNIPEHFVKKILMCGVSMKINGTKLDPILGFLSQLGAAIGPQPSSMIRVLPMQLHQSAKIKPSLPPKPATLKPSLPSTNPLAQGNFSESASLKPSPSPKKPLLRGNIPEFPVLKPPPQPKNAACYNAEVDKKKIADTNLKNEQFYVYPVEESEEQRSPPETKLESDKVNAACYNAEVDKKKKAGTDFKNEQFHVYPVEESEEQRSPPETKLESDKLIANGYPEPSTSGNFVADHTETIKMVIDENSRSVRSHTLNVSLKFQRNSIGREVHLEVRATTAANVPPIPCTVGEAILSDVIKIEPIGIKFAKAARLSMKHSVFDMPEFSSIVIMCYDSESEEWVSLPCNTGRSWHKPCLFIVALLYQVFHTFMLFQVVLKAESLF